MKVRIKCSQRIYYDQTVEMTRQEWKEIKASQNVTDALYGWLDTRDILDADEVDDDDMEAYECEEEGQPTKPYNGVGG